MFLLTIASAMAGGCSSVGVSGRAAYASFRLDGDLALDSAGGGFVGQDVGSAFGLGDAQGTPYYAVRVDADGPVFDVSAFWLRDSGEGRLDGSFGGLLAGTEVTSRLDLAVIGVSAAWEFDAGPVRLSPGVLFDVLALDFTAREVATGGREEVDDVVFLPLPFLRAAVGDGPFEASGQLGFLDVGRLGDSSGRFVDAELTLTWRPDPRFELFTGYRYLAIDGDGRIREDRFATDLSIAGWMVGGGVRF